MKFQNIHLFSCHLTNKRFKWSIKLSAECSAKGQSVVHRGGGCNSGGDGDFNVGNYVGIWEMGVVMAVHDRYGDYGSDVCSGSGSRNS